MIPKNVQMPNPNPKYKPPGTTGGGRGGTLMDNYNIEEVQKIVDILMNADAVMCVSNFAPQRYFSNILYEIPMGYTINVNFEKLATALWDAGYRKEET